MAEHVDLTAGAFKKKMKETIGYTGVDLEARKHKSRTEETNLGNLICDIIRTESDADMAIINAGCLRLDEVIPKGPIKLRKLYKLQPYPANIVVLKVKGIDFLAALENSVSRWPGVEGRFS